MSICLRARSDVFVATQEQGKAPQQGRHLYYRCTGRVQNYPLPAACLERGINARIADALVWLKMAELMGSKELMLKQSKRCIDARHSKLIKPPVDIVAMKKEISKLKEQDGRYTKAYGAGVYSMDELQDYVAPVKAKIASLESEISEGRCTE